MSGFDMKDRVVVNLSETQQKVDRFVDDINALCRNPELKKLLSEQDIAEINSAVSTLEKHSKDKLNVVIAGSFKRGKSTFINSLLGENVTPTNVTPETITINKIVYGEEAAAEAVLKDGMRLRLYDEEITRERLEKIIAEVPAPIDYLEIRRNIPLLKELTFIDTPGLNDAEDFRQPIMGAMLSADIIVYVVSSISPLSSDEQVFLNTVVMPQNFSKMFLVINMADVLDNEDDAERIKNEITRRAYNFNDNASVHILSALDEYCRKTGEKRPNPDMTNYLETHFEEFNIAFSEDVLLQKELIKSQRIINIEKQIISLLRFKADSVTQMMNMSEQNLDETERRLYEEKLNIDAVLGDTKKKVEHFVDGNKGEARVWMDSFMHRIKGELNGLGDKATGQQLQKHLHFYLSDKVKEAFMSCIEEHTAQMQEMLEKEIHDFDDIELSKNDAYKGISIRIKDISWTNVSTAFFIGEQVSSIVGLNIGGIFCQAIGGFLRQRKISKSQKDIIKPLLDDFGALTNEVFAQLEDAYGKYSEQAQSSIEEHFRKSIDDALQTIQHAKQVNAEFSAKKTETLEVLSDINLTLDKIEEKI